MKIAALLDRFGRAATPSAGGTLYIYERQGSNWVTSERVTFSTVEHLSMQELRRYLAEVSGWLGDCKVVAARASHGYYRVAFGSLGVALWAVRGVPQDFIEQIEGFYAHADAAAQQTEPAPPPAAIEPIPGRAGHYRLDLREAMAVKGAHNSRRVLLPFFRDTSFVRLEMVCDHVPRWFDSELPELGLRATVESQSTFCRVHVYPLKAAEQPLAPSSLACRRAGNA